MLLLEHTAEKGQKVRVTTPARHHLQFVGAFFTVSFDCEKQIITQSVSSMGARAVSVLTVVKSPA